MEDSILVPCVAWQEKLAALHRADLSPTERKALEAHVASCSACATTLTDYKKIRSLIRKVVMSKIELPDWLMQDDLVTKLPELPPLHTPQNGAQRDLEPAPLRRVESTGNVG
jgi:hypothetical protein